ncbi:MAG: acetyl-CoA carboxylase carboxyltransferase subunit alpha [Candidatus Margulisiibacteriota bacterium]|jgi:acetyl-CoA carboxylase carboxyl transferase subunit alpha
MARSLDFEKPIQEIYDKIADLKRLTNENQIDFTEEINMMEKRAQVLRSKIYHNLSPIQTLQIARHPERPGFADYTQSVFKDFTELHGDRVFGDDTALVGGLAFLDDQGVMVIGHQKGKDTKSNIYRNFGMGQPEGYRKAMRLMYLAQKMNKPIITLVDTPGAYPGKGSEERGVAEAIARNLQEMMELTVPVVVVITGEGGSGGALGISIGNTVAMLEHTIYSVISPEGCASILYRDSKKVETALENLQVRAEDLKRLGVIDEIIPEPTGGAHHDPDKMAKILKKYLVQEVARLKTYTINKLKDERYKKFRKLGIFTETQSEK